MSEKVEKKKPYTKPVIETHGKVEQITLKMFGSSDAMLFEGDQGGVGGGGVS